MGKLAGGSGKKIFNLVEERYGIGLIRNELVKRGR
jgi:hypothetical protein